MGCFVKLPNLSPTESPPTIRVGELLWPDLLSWTPLEQKPAPFPALGRFSSLGDSSRLCGQKVLCSGCVLSRVPHRPSGGSRGGLGVRTPVFEYARRWKLAHDADGTSQEVASPSQSLLLKMKRYCLLEWMRPKL